MSAEQPAGAPPTPPPAPLNPNDPGRGPMIMGVTWTFTAVALLIVAARFYVRATVNRKISLDDWFMLVASMLQVTFQSFITVAFTYGLGKHDLDIPIANFAKIMMWNYISTTPAVLVSMTARISANILLTRLFGNKNWLKWFLWIFTAFQAVASILLIAFVWAQSDPVQGLWNPMLPARRWDPRIQLYMSYLTQSAFTFSDLTYVLFPVVVIWDLHMPIRRKVGLSLLMALSLVTAFASIMKTVTTPSADAATKPDAQYNASMAVLWSGIEQTMVIILSCIAPLRAKFIAVMRKHFGWVGAGLVGMVSGSKVTGNRTNKSGRHNGYIHSTGGEFDNTSHNYNFRMESGRDVRYDDVKNSIGSSNTSDTSMDDLPMQRVPTRPPVVAGRIHRTDHVEVTYGQV